MSDSPTFYQRQCVYLPAMAGWFLTSALLSSYNKILFGKDNLAFPYPLFLTSVQFFVQWIFSFTISTICPDFFGGKVVRDMSWRVFLSVSIPCGVVTAVDIGLSNLAIVRISITLYTMVKSSSTIWVLISAFMFGLEKVTCNLIMVGLLITAGEILTAFGEVEFDTIGFLLCLGAAICGGIRWTLVQFRLQKLDPPLGGPVVTMRVVAPTMFFSMLALSLMIEQPWNLLDPEQGDYFNNFKNGMTSVSVGLLGATLAVTMVLCEFLLLLKSDAIVLMIGGVLKEILTICVGVVYFKDQLNIINTSGIVVVFMGVLLYKVTRHISKTEAEAEPDTLFSRVIDTPSDINEEQVLPHRAKQARGKKNSNPDNALTFTIDDEDIDDGILINGDALSPLRGQVNGAFELENENYGRIKRWNPNQVISKY